MIDSSYPFKPEAVRFSRRLKVLPTIPDKLDLSAGEEGIEKFFPSEALSGAATMTAHQLKDNFDIENSEFSIIKNSFEQAIRIQVKSGLKEPTSDGFEDHPMANPKYVFAYNSPDDHKYKHWYGNLPGQNALMAWNEYLENRYENDSGQRILVENAVKERVEKIYKNVVVNRNEDQDLNRIVKSIVDESQQETETDMDQTIQKNIELLMRLANITWFSTQYARAVIENSPQRIEKDRDFTDFNSMVRDNQAHHLENPNEESGSIAKKVLLKTVRTVSVQTFT